MSVRSLNEYTVQCAQCRERSQVSASVMLRAIRHFKAVGWKATGDGWICPSCIESGGQES